MKKALIAALAVAAIAIPAASATAPPDHKVTICHATGSVTNPFRIITIDVAGNDNGHIGVGFHQDGLDSYFVDGKCGDPKGDPKG